MKQTKNDEWMMALYVICGWGEGAGGVDVGWVCGVGWRRNRQ